MDILYLLFFILYGTNLLVKKVQGIKGEKIVGGLPVYKNRFKYVVALMYREQGLPDQNPCTAAILGNFHVITVAHCFFIKPSGDFIQRFFYIIAGAPDLKEPSQYSRYIAVQTVTLPKIYDPKKPDSHSTIGNMAVVKLNESLQLHPNHPGLAVTKVRVLHTRKINENFSVAGYGWNRVELILTEVNGKTEYMQVGASDGKLRYAKAKILNDSECYDKIQDINIAPGNMCAKILQPHPEEPAGICKGDSGAPLTQGTYLEGIAINGFLECDESQMPGIYININFYQTFIIDALENKKTFEMRILKMFEKPLFQYEFKEIPMHEREENTNIGIPMI